MNGGPFVACSDFGIGKVRAVHGSTIEVEYFDSVASQVIRAIHVDSARGATLSVQTRCYWLADGHWCVGRVQGELPEAYSVVSHRQTRVVPKTDLFVRWAKPLEDPTEVLVARACESPRFHASRLPYIASLVRQRAASRGLAGVLSSRVELHRHQIEIARRVLEDPVPRYLLADEVGLGKTIEAGFILRQFFLDNPTGRALIVVPPFLVEQWREELTTKFALDDFRRGTVRIASHLDDGSWADGSFDIVVVDEAHNLAERSLSPDACDRRRYERIVEIARHTPRLLLLSATPLLHNEETFLAMLHILDPDSYRLDGIHDLRAMVAARAEVGRVLLGFKEEAPTFLLGDFVEELRRLFPPTIGASVGSSTSSTKPSHGKTPRKACYLRTSRRKTRRSRVVSEPSASTSRRRIASTSVSYGRGVALHSRRAFPCAVDRSRRSSSSATPISASPTAGSSGGATRASLHSPWSQTPRLVAPTSAPSPTSFRSSWNVRSPRSRRWPSPSLLAAVRGSLAVTSLI
jgi:hypothetical protein